MKKVGRRYVCFDDTMVNLDHVEKVRNNGDYLTIYFGSGKMVSTHKGKLQDWIDIIQDMEGERIDIIEKMEGNNAK